MLTDSEIMFEWKGIPGVPLCWVIDGDVLYDYPLTVEHSKMFLEHDEVVDISDQYPDHDGITISFLKNGEVMEELQTSEYFGSILLSNPQVINLNDYPYGEYVAAPYAKFDGEKFIIIGRDVSGLPE